MRAADCGLPRTNKATDTGRQITCDRCEMFANDTARDKGAKIEPRVLPNVPAFQRRGPSHAEARTLEEYRNAPANGAESAANAS